MKNRYIIILGTSNLMYTYNALRLFDGNLNCQEDWSPYKEYSVLLLPIYVLVLRKEIPHGKELVEIKRAKRNFWFTTLLIIIYFAFAAGLYILLHKKG